MSEIAAFQDLGVFSNSLNSLDNEIEVLKSRSLIAKVVKELNLNVQYKFQGRIQTVEYYNNAPVKLNFIEGDSILDITKVDFKLVFLSKTQYSIENEEQGYIGTFYFGRKASTPYGDLMITRRGNEMPINPVVYINVNPVINMADDYRKKITVKPLSKQATIITISLVDAVKHRAQDFINTLIKQYNTDGIDEKNGVSNNTAKFISKRLNLIQDELNLVESEVASYKQSYELTDITAEASCFRKYSK